MANTGAVLAKIARLCYTVSATQFHISLVRYDKAFRISFSLRVEIVSQQSEILCRACLRLKARFLYGLAKNFWRHKMKRKLLFVLLTIIMVVSCAIGLAACGGNDENSGSSVNGTYYLYEKKRLIKHST